MLRRVSALAPICARQNLFIPEPVQSRMEALAKHNGRSTLHHYSVCNIRPRSHRMSVKQEEINDCSHIFTVEYVENVFDADVAS